MPTPQDLQDLQPFIPIIVWAYNQIRAAIDKSKKASQRDTWRD